MNSATDITPPMTTEINQGLSEIGGGCHSTPKLSKNVAKRVIPKRSRIFDAVTEGKKRTARRILRIDLYEKVTPRVIIHLPKMRRLYDVLEMSMQVISRMKTHNSEELYHFCPSPLFAVLTKRHYALCGPTILLCFRRCSLNTFPAQRGACSEIGGCLFTHYFRVVFRL